MNAEELSIIQKVFEHWLNPIVVTDNQGTIQFVNPAFSRITGYSEQEVIGKNPRILKSFQHPSEFYQNLWRQIIQKGSWFGVIWNRKKNGEVYLEWKTIFAIQDQNGNTTHYAAIAYDINHIKEQESIIEQFSQRNENTGIQDRRLPNYTSSMNRETYKAYSLEKDLHSALPNQEFELYYQPRIEMKSGNIVGAEALIRWNHPKWGLVSPMEFIPLAEETGLISDIDEWVKVTVCKQIRDWQQAGVPAIPISINVFAQEFMKRDFPHKLQSSLKQTGVDGKWLEIEITESFMIQNAEVVRDTIERLRNLGIKVSLDDFGTGYSSLHYLTQFSIDILKIDKSFISESTTKPQIATILQSMIQMAHGLQLEIVVEGVETEEQLALLRQLHCQYVQGYLFSPPVPADQFIRML